jgi:hypothetical protein
MCFMIIRHPNEMLRMTRWGLCLDGAPSRGHAHAAGGEEEQVYFQTHPAGR